MSYATLTNISWIYGLHELAWNIYVIVLLIGNDNNNDNTAYDDNDNTEDDYYNSKYLR